MAQTTESELEKHFETFCNFGIHHPGTDRKQTLNDKNLVKCLKDSRIIGKVVTSTDVDIAFSKYKDKGKKEITFDQFKSVLLEIAPKYQKQAGLGSKENALQEMMDKIAGSGPSLAGTTKMSATGNVERMTDTTLYTGSHKERFDEEGKGRGIEGRKNIVENEGYVGQYKGKDTYDKTHPSPR